jgi:dUTP pyrophosphatase
MENILFAKLREGAKIPKRDIWNAGLDLYPCFDEPYLVIPPHETRLVPTGIASVIPVDYYIQIQERGSSGSKGIKYSAGVIDSSYRGEWFLATTNCNSKPLVILKEDMSTLPDSFRKLIEETMIVYPYSKALFQGIVHNVHNELGVEEIPADKIADYPSERGSGKLGSSGK